MPDKLTDKEIVKALKDLVKELKGKKQLIVSEQGVKNLCYGLQNFLDLINRQDEKMQSLQAENERLQETIDEQDIEIARLYKEIDRWISAYEQAVRERDIFAEDMKEEIKKDCAYLMLDIKTIKTEAYEECIEKVKEELAEWVGADNSINYSRIKKVCNNLLKELVGEDNG